MRPTPDKMSAFMALLKKKMNFKSLVITLAAIVVFTTTYLLVLPAFTLDKEEAAEQGGIDVAVEQTVETADEEAPAEQAEEPAAEQKESAEAVTEAEEPSVKEEVKEETASPKQEDSDVKEEKKEDKEEVKLLSKKKELTAEKEKTDNFTISAVVDKAAKVPEDVFLQATELTKDTEDFDYDKYYKDALKVLKKDADNVKGIKTIKFYDISLEAESQDESVEPKAAVNVKIAYEDGLKVKDADNIRIVHFAEQKNGEVKAEVLDSKENKVETTVNKKSEMTEASFDTEGFSVFAVAEMELVNEFTITNPDGKKVTYLVTATYGPKAEIPEGATLSVTEFGKLNAEYKKAYDAVVSKKSSENESFDKETFGMNAFDISIVDAEGNKVEPKDTVDISLKIKELPEEATNSFTSGSLEIQHLDESQNELKVETVASVEDGSIQINDKSAVAEFKLDSFSTFTINWNRNTTTIHYGYEDENGTFHEFTKEPSPTATTTDGGWAYLIYDFDGTEDGKRFEYNYSKTYYRDQETNKPSTEGTSVAPVLRYNNNNWRYYAASHGYAQNSLTNGNYWESAGNGSHLYVVYKKPTIQEGGKPKLDPDTPDPDLPTILKQSVENGDDTNTLSLNITSSSKVMEVETLADVIIVLDLSSSMAKPIDSETALDDYIDNEDSRYYQAKEAVKTLAEDLYAKNTTKDLYRLGLVTFAGNAQVRQELTTDKDLFLSKVDAINGYDGKGTNWEHSIKLANEMDVDPNRATFVIFVTDGEPTTSQTRDSRNEQLTNEQLGSANLFIPGNTGGGIPNNAWELQNHSFLYYYLRSGTYGTTNAGANGTVARTSTAAYNDIQSVMDHKKNVYVIAISKEITDRPAFGELQDLVTVDHVKKATQKGDIEAAFDVIASEITGTVGWGDVQMTDGITDLTNTVAKTDLVSFDDKFTYYKTEKAPEGWSTWTKEQKDAYQTGIDYASKTGNPEGYDGWSQAKKDAFQAGRTARFVVWTDAARTEAKCQPATYKDGAVLWNMGTDFMPEDGVTYRVSFKCWPSQESYDTLAKCENDPTYYDNLDPKVKEQIKRTEVSTGKYNYTLKTNKDGANTTFKSATNQGGKITTSGGPIQLDFGEVPDLVLSEEQISVKKEWENMIDGRAEKSINIGVLAKNFGKEDDLFAIINLKDHEGYDDDWKGSAYISTGLMEWRADSSNPAGGELIILETGHDFTLTEKVEGGPSWRWELVADTYRPMVITDSRHGYTVPTTVMLKKVESTDNYDYDILDKKPGTQETTHSYYKIVGGPTAELTATNYRRSNLNLTKKVVDADGNDVSNKFKDEVFKFTVTATDSSAEAGAEKTIYFSVVDENLETIFDITTSATAEEREVDENDPDVSDLEYDSEKGTITYYYKDSDEPTTYKVLSHAGSKYQCETGYYYVSNGANFTVEMKPKWNLRITNLPTESTYTITESAKENFECLGSSYVSKYGEDEPTKPAWTYGAVYSNKIDMTNTEYTVTYSNKTNLFDIKIVKTDNGTPPKNLGGATFDLYKKNSGDTYERIKENLVVPEDGLKVEGLSIGDYKLVELTPPDGYNIKIKDIFFKITGNSNPVITLDADYGTDASVKGNSKDELHVQNPPGPELPMTGGIGTTIFYILGSILAVGCGIVLIARKRAGISR